MIGRIVKKKKKKHMLDVDKEITLIKKIQTASTVFNYLKISKIPISKYVKYKI